MLSFDSVAHSFHLKGDPVVKIVRVTRAPNVNSDSIPKPYRDVIVGLTLPVASDEELAAVPPVMGLKKMHTRNLVPIPRERLSEALENSEEKKWASPFWRTWLERNRQPYFFLSGFRCEVIKDESDAA